MSFPAQPATGRFGDHPRCERWAGHGYLPSTAPGLRMPAGSNADRAAELQGVPGDVVEGGQRRGGTRAI